MSGPNDRKLCGQSGGHMDTRTNGQTDIGWQNNHRNKSLWPQNHQWFGERLTCPGLACSSTSSCPAGNNLHNRKPKNPHPEKKLRQLRTKPDNQSSFIFEEMDICPLHAQDIRTSGQDSLGHRMHLVN